MPKDRKNIVIDIGNTRIKSGEFRDGRLLMVKEWDDLHSLSLSIQAGSKLIISSVSANETELKSHFEDLESIIFSHKTSIPIDINYKTPETLGLDRIAGVVAAFEEFKSSCLVIDLGTCITYDVIDDSGTYKGGAISPGMKMRMRSMHELTANLPDITLDWKSNAVGFPGQSTKESLSSGVIDGIEMEIMGFIDQSAKKFGKINVIMTGGDARLFETNLKAAIFVRPNLVLVGLNRILEYNEVT